MTGTTLGSRPAHHQEFPRPAISSEKEVQRDMKYQLLYSSKIDFLSLFMFIVIFLTVIILISLSLCLPPYQLLNMPGAYYPCIYCVPGVFFLWAFFFD